MFRIRRVFLPWFVLLSAFVTSVCPVGAETMTRGVVVDRDERILWLGLTAPVPEGSVFNISLMPGSGIIARAVVISSTPDAPFVANARYSLLDPSTTIPIGAYAEMTTEPLPDEPEWTEWRALRPEARRINPLRFQLGILFPTGTALRDETDWAGPHVQISYGIYASPQADVSLGLGFYRQSGAFTVGELPGERDFRAVPLTVEARIRSASAEVGWFGLLGIGAYLVTDERIIADISDETTKTTLGWQLGIGYESESGRSAQISYLDVSRTDLRGISFLFGIRF